MALFRRGRKDDDRKPQPALAQGGTVLQRSGVWGSIDLPNPSPATVLGLPAADHALNIIANGVAEMTPAEQWVDGYVQDATPLILRQPNVTFGTFEFFHMVVGEALMHGNFLAIKADFQDGYPRQLVPVPWGLWFAYYEGGRVIYDVAGMKYGAQDVFHVRINCGANQPMGIGVVAKFRRQFGMALDSQNFAADTYRSGSVPAGVIKVDVPEFDEDQARAIAAQWIENHAGGRAPAVIPSMYTYEPLTWSPKDMQFLEEQQFQVATIAHMFNLSATDLDTSIGGTSMTYANIEQRTQDRITQVFQPWMRRIEEQLTDCLPQGEARLDAEKLLRTDSKTRAEVNQINIATGITSVEEARKVEGRKPLPKPEPEPQPKSPEVFDTPAPDAQDDGGQEQQAA